MAFDQEIYFVGGISDNRLRDCEVLNLRTGK